MDRRKTALLNAPSSFKTLSLKLSVVYAVLEQHIQVLEKCIKCIKLNLVNAVLEQHLQSVLGNVPRFLTNFHAGYHGICCSRTAYTCPQKCKTGSAEQ